MADNQNPEVDYYDLIETLKVSIGDFGTSTPDEYYQDKLETAVAEFLAEDISVKQLNSDLGKKAVVFYAKTLMDGGDIATNPTINLHKSKLSLATKGDRYRDVH